MFASLAQLQRHGYGLVSDEPGGLITSSFPQASHELVQRFMRDVFSSQGVEFDAVFVCPHHGEERCACRKPAVGLTEAYLRERRVDIAGSAMVGDRDTDLAFARNIGVLGLTARRHGEEGETWPAIEQVLTARRTRIARSTRETCIDVNVNLDAPAPLSAATGIGFFDHILEQLAQHGGFALELSCRVDLRIDEA